MQLQLQQMLRLLSLGRVGLVNAVGHVPGLLLGIDALLMTPYGIVSSCQQDIKAMRVVTSGSAVRLVEAVRVHGGEGVSGSVEVHTPDLPHSLAWLSPGGRLTFGELDHTTHLRWFTLGVLS